MNSCIHNMVNQGKEIPNLPPYRGWGRDCNVGGGGGWGGERSEGVILQFCNDGGITWNILGEQLHTEYTSTYI